MSITVKAGGFEAICDSPTEAAELIRQLGTVPPPTATGQKGQEVPPSSHGNRYQLFFRGLDDDVRQAVKTLRDAAGQIGTNDWAQKIGIPPGQIKYFVRKIRSAAERQQIKPDDVINTERVYEDRKPKSKYQMSKSAKEALANVT